MTDRFAVGLYMNVNGRSRSRVAQEESRPPLTNPGYGLSEEAGVTEGRGTVLPKPSPPQSSILHRNAGALPSEQLQSDNKIPIPAGNPL